MKLRRHERGPSSKGEKKTPEGTPDGNSSSNRLVWLLRLLLLRLHSNNSTLRVMVPRHSVVISAAAPLALALLPLRPRHWRLLLDLHACLLVRGQL